MKIIQRIYQLLVALIDNPFTISLVFVSLTVSLYFYFLGSFISNLNLQTKDYDYIRESIQWFGILYGLVIPLSLVRVQTQFGESQRLFDKEAGIVFELYNTFLLLSKRQIDLDSKTAIIGYIHHVVNLGLDEYKNRNVKLSGDDHIDKIRDAVKKLIKKRKT